MNLSARYFLVAALALAMNAQAMAIETTTKAPIRHVVYTFTVGIQSSKTVRDSGIGTSPQPHISSVGGSSSGVAEVKGSVSDEGTIVVDIVAESADGGLVVKVSEQARNGRTAEPALCAIYSWNLSAICNSEAKIYDEEGAIVRLVGRNFIASGMDAVSSHWLVPGTMTNGSESNAFTVMSNHDGVLNITEDRITKVGGPDSYDATTSGTIRYNNVLTLPVGLHELAIRRNGSDGSGQTTIHTYIDLTLASDSMGAKP